MVSAHVDMAFGNADGAWVQELRLEQRAMFIGDATNVVRYGDDVPAIPQHPDDAAALAVLKAVS